ncbi:PAS domain-containing protein [Nakamurella flavida]|uniref:histidine kinase n=1 Tax=Nakamurella flavida TaxID=363630 RepID=A0A939C5N4_9ACTN|nr:ATP-binding protein [Nakamurella flavida]MBM9476372.1 PAS domain-containing protein [Nakamurella flavida]MDP9779528.1 signal transduction histidine kinase [Nakamurella flavida]
MIGRAGERAGGLIDSNTTVERQVVLAVLFGLAQLMLLVPGVQMLDLTMVVASWALFGLATLAALFTPWDRYPPSATMVLPLLDIVSVGLLRGGTGASASIYGSLWILCAISLGAEPGRTATFLAMPLTMVLTILPALGTQTLAGPDWARAFFLPLVLGMTALLVNELTRRLRGRLAMVDDLRRRQSDLLAHARDQAARSSATSALLRESTKELQSVMDAVTEQSIMGSDLTGRIDVFNAGAAKMLGYRPVDVIGRMHITDMHLAEELTGDGTRRDPQNLAEGPRALPEQVEGLVGLARQGIPDVRAWMKVRADGSVLPVQVAVTARRDEHGRIVGFLFVGTDMTATVEQSRLKDEFVNLISHELRTPLSSILGYLELVADDPDNPLSEEQQRYLGTVERNANRLLRLVSDLLFTAQVESGGFHISEQALDVTGLVRASLETAGPAAAARSVTLDVQAPAEPVLVLGDPTRLSQAVDNLLSNAVKFTRPGGSVVVGVRVESAPADAGTAEPDVCISVRDTGIGIPEEELDRLFNRFFRASTARTEAVPGVGLGLTITKAIATAHGGTIELASTVGTGTTFTIRLPRRLPADAERRPVPVA